MKRKLDSKYSELVKYINERKDNFEIMNFCKEILEETDNWTQDTPDTREYKMIFSIYNYDFDYPERDKLVPIIVDIYNDNYELEEPEYYWKFNELKGFNKCDLYFGITLDTELLLIDVATRGTAKKCTKSELNDYLLDTNLTTDNFTPTEVLN